MMSTVTSVCGVLVFCLAVGVSAGPAAGNRTGAGQESGPTLEPMPMEAFALRPGARLVWTRWIGMIESEDAAATVTAIVLDDPAAAPRTVRGLRVDLEHKVENPSCNLRFLGWSVMCARANAALYYSEDRLDAVRDGILRGAAEAHEPNGIVRMSSSVRGSGVLIAGYSFHGVTLEELADLFSKGMAALGDVR